MRAVVTGATGFVGRLLLGKLPSSVVLSRDPGRTAGRLQEFPTRLVAWEPAQEPAPAAALEDADAVFHLAGEPIAEGRWTAAKKRRLWDSRVEGTRQLIAGLERVRPRPRVLVCASAIGYYGDRGDRELRETDSPGEGFLAELCVAWERAAVAAETLGMRVVRLRIGLVLGTSGGLLARLVPLFRLGLGSPLGRGDQWMSWIAVDDLVALLLASAEQETYSGPVNATGPQPVTNRQFTATLAGVLGRPAWLPAVPTWALRIAVGEFASGLVASHRVVPARALEEGFVFQHPSLQDTLQHLLGPGQTKPDVEP